MAARYSGHGMSEEAEAARRNALAMTAVRDYVSGLKDCFDPPIDTGSELNSVQVLVGYMIMSFDKPSVREQNLRRLIENHNLLPEKIGDIIEILESADKDRKRLGYDYNALAMYGERLIRGEIPQQVS